MPLVMSRSELPVIALAEPDAFAALLASHFSPPSLPLHGATRIATVHAIVVWAPPFVTSIFLTVEATMYACALFVERSLLVGKPPGQVLVPKMCHGLVLEVRLVSGQFTRSCE